VADAVRFARAAGSEKVEPMADTFHMNIEEAHIGATLEATAAQLGYVHLSDSNRMEPGAGHIDFGEVFAALDAGGYDGWASIECNWSSTDEAECLERTVRFLRETMETVGKGRE
jgi:sugar phosphate isomerase/epimerase